MLYFWRHQNNFLLINFHLIQRSWDSARSSEPPGGRAQAASLRQDWMRTHSSQGRAGTQPSRHTGHSQQQQQQQQHKLTCTVGVLFERTWNVVPMAFCPSSREGSGFVCLFILAKWLFSYIHFGFASWRTEALLMLHILKFRHKFSICTHSKCFENTHSKREFLKVLMDSFLQRVSDYERSNCLRVDGISLNRKRSSVSRFFPLVTTSP